MFRIISWGTGRPPVDNRVCTEFCVEHMHGHRISVYRCQIVVLPIGDEAEMTEVDLYLASRTL